MSRNILNFEGLDFENCHDSMSELNWKFEQGWSSRKLSLGFCVAYFAGLIYKTSFTFGSATTALYSKKTGTTFCDPRCTCSHLHGSW